MEQIKFEDLPLGQHLWVMAYGELMMVAKLDEKGYQQCGPWEGGIISEACKIIELVDKPKGYENTKLFYHDK